MALSERQKIILAAIVKLHILSGEPVGSKLLCETLENAPSSATLRNEMSTLCDMGYLEQPHTSAGRIPTAAGYRLYIETLMEKGVLSDENRRYIDSALSPANCDPEKLPENAGKVLSDITGLPALSVDISPNGPALRRVELMKLGDRLAMMIIITSDGRSRSRLCHTSESLTDDLMAKFDKIVADKLLKRRTAELSAAYMQNATACAGLDAFSLMPLMSSLSVMISDIENSAVSITGQSSLFNISMPSFHADKIISLIHKRDTLLSLLSGSTSPIGVVFGGETKFSALKPSSIIFAKYSAGNNNQSCLGVIGPTRMSYEQIIPSIEYTAKRINDLLTEALSSMEE